jgi:hypothetical protein
MPEQELFPFLRRLENRFSGWLETPGEEIYLYNYEFQLKFLIFQKRERVRRIKIARNSSGLKHFEAFVLIYANIPKTTAGVGEQRFIAGLSTMSNFHEYHYIKQINYANNK